MWQNAKKQKLQKEDDSNEIECVIEGRRIVELKVSAQHLYCKFCKEILSLGDTKREVKRGLASIFTDRCRKCLETSLVPTSKMHAGVMNYIETFN